MRRAERRRPPGSKGAIAPRGPVYYRDHVSFIARCISTDGLGCSHWGEFVYAWHQAGLLVVVGLVFAALLGVAGLRHHAFLQIAAGVALATVIGFLAYYIDL